MAASRHAQRLIDRLPAVRGRLIEDAALSKLTWFRVGGPAEVLFRPADVDDLQSFLAEKPADVPVTVVGVGSNLMVRDGGIPGVTIRLGDGFSDVVVTGATIIAGGGASNLKVANATKNAGLTGFEFLCGIPGSVGGSLRMNAGAYGAEIAGIMTSLTALSGSGDQVEIGAADMGYSYRHSALPDDHIVINGVFKGRAGDADEIAAAMAKIQAERETTQPVKSATGGSTFVNPEGQKAWELIDQAGGRGLTRGGAMVSEKHTNFLINTGEATAADLEGLGEEVRRRVFEETGVTLEWEIQRIGVHAGDGPEEVAS
ncbi:MAG: UDP-N-acetylmuramate dehydrogenase [Rhodospirillaceae bacterium]